MIFKMLNHLSECLSYCHTRTKLTIPFYIIFISDDQLGPLMALKSPPCQSARHHTTVIYWISIYSCWKLNFVPNFLKSDKELLYLALSVFMSGPTYRHVRYRSSMPELNKF